ncbi:MAG: hypothetical protein IH889_07445 [Planctomycetes bacterium]|nr:hypothetical protein [Planctomycetota bacterium]
MHWAFPDATLDLALRQVDIDGAGSGGRPAPPRESIAMNPYHGPESSDSSPPHFDWWGTASDDSGSSAAAPGDASPSPGDQVLGILADIERQFGRLRSAQCHHNEQFAEAQGRDVQSRRQVDEQREEIAREQSELAQQRDELQSARAQLLQEQQQSQEHHERRRAELHETESELTRQGNELQAQRERLASLESQLHRQSQDSEEQLQRLQQQVERGRGELDAQRRQQETEVGQIGSLRSRVGELEEALADAGRRAAGPQQEATVQIASLNEQVEVLKAELQRRDASLADARNELNIVRGTLSQRSDAQDQLQCEQQRIAELEQQLNEVRAAQAEAADARGAQISEDLQKKAQRISAAAKHWQRRRQRLAKVRQATRGRARRARTDPEQAQRRIKQDQAVENQRRRLVEIRESLAAAERKMQRKWARPRAVVTFSWLAVSLAVVAIASGLAANHFFPAMVAASVDVEAEARSGLPFSDEDAAKWQTWHSALLIDKNFHRTLAKRLADRRLDRYKDPVALAQRLRDDLTVDAAQPGVMTLTLAGTDRGEITAILDTLATTFARESSRQAGKRSDGARTVVRGEHKEAGRTRYASINPVPIRDQRLLYAGIIFGVGSMIGLGVVMTIGRRLLQAKRIFDSQGAVT